MSDAEIRAFMVPLCPSICEYTSYVPPYPSTYSYSSSSFVPHCPSTCEYFSYVPLCPSTCEYTSYVPPCPSTFEYSSYVPLCPSTCEYSSYVPLCPSTCEYSQCLKTTLFFNNSRSLLKMRKRPSNLEILLWSPHGQATVCQLYS